jgi:hypothetical protein
MKKYTWITAFFILSILLSLSGCSAAKALTPEEIILKSAEEMKATTGFKFLFVRTGAPAYIDANQSYALSQLEGSYAAPDKVQATVRVVAAGIVAEVDVISIGADQWQTNPITGKWQKLPENYGFNPSQLLDPAMGLPAIIGTDISNLTLGEQEELEAMPGKKLYTITGDLAGEKLNELSYGLLGPEAMTVKLWIDPETFDLYRTVITEFPGDAQKETVWTIDFWDFNVVEEISAPAVP